MPHSILMAGLPTRLSSRLADRLPRALVEVAFSPKEVLQTLGERDWSVLLLGAAVEERPVEELARQVRLSPDGAGLRLAVVLDPLERPEDLERVDPLVELMGVDRVFFEPVDPGELAHFVAEADGGLPALPPEPQASASATLAGRLAEVWTRSRETILGRVGLLEKAARAARAGQLPRVLRDDALRDAHRLSGLLGTLGLPEGSRQAAEAEAILQADRLPTGTAAERLEEISAALRRLVQAHAVALPPDAPVAEGPPGVAGLRVIARDPVLVQAASRAAAGRGLSTAPDDGSAPLAILVEADEEGEVWDTLKHLGAEYPGVPVLLAAGRDSLLDRVRAVKLGVTAVVLLPAGEEVIAEALDRLLPAAGIEGRHLLALDDDEAALEAVRALLRPHGVSVHGETDPVRFWERLTADEPDLVVLDVEMPHLNGVEVCRVLRADPRFRDLPVLFLTARSDRDTILRIFAAGADDYVAKPLVGPELIARIQSRLGRGRGVRGDGRRS